MLRTEFMGQVAEGRPYDVIVVGGGASGLGCAVDASARGYRTLLLEQADFAKGTSSRSTKLVHGGVRYLQQGNISLVREALHERGLMYANAPHLVTDLSFIVPRYKWWEGPFYGIGLKLYDLLAGRLNLAPSQSLDVEETMTAIPNLQRAGMNGGTRYHDGQFDDARMCVSLARTACDLGATVLNYSRVVGINTTDGGHVCGVQYLDAETGVEYEVSASVVVNATGVFTDSVREMEDANASPVVMSSRGVHLVLDQSFLQGDTAIMVPHTDDGRVLFVIPWHGRCLVGTTDEETPDPVLEPRATDEEVAFILRNASRYLARDPERGDVLSVFAGLRPLVRHEGQASKRVSREHEVLVSRGGLVSIVGGKWTTYRRMAEDAIDHAADVGGLPPVQSPTSDLQIRGWLDRSDPAMPEEDWVRVYGADAPAMWGVCDEHASGRTRIHPSLPYPRGVVAYSARYEAARTVEDVLSRRTRALLLDAAAASEAAEMVAALLARELGRDDAWVSAQIAAFRGLAGGYMIA